MISLSEFLAACPSNKEPDTWVSALNAVLPKYEIDTVKREGMFLAQTGHESLDYRVTVENLNYSEKGLLTVFPKYYTRALANAHARKPITIANHVYGGRMDNNRDGDGWFFRGLGVIQLTGRYNHTEFGKTIGMTAEQVRVHMETKEGQIEAACWFWQTRNINKYADVMDIGGATRTINGGFKGIVDRESRLRRILSVRDDVEYHAKTTLYKFGDNGEMVKSIQIALGINADGDFGKKTKAAVKAYQTKQGLTPDGIVGDDTLKSLGL